MFRGLAILAAVLLLQAQPSLSEVEERGEEGADSSKTLEILGDLYQSALTRATDVGQTMLDFSKMYYQDHIRPITEKYIELASDTGNSMWERISGKWTEYFEN